MVRFATAPGRVNLIGEHTDYNDGLVLPIAIDLCCRVEARPAARWRATSRQMGETVDVTGPRPGHWSQYVAGAIAEFGQTPMELVIDSAIPVGSGLSFSAALEVALALAIAGPRDPLELVQRANRVEREFVGLPCGLLDHYAAVFGRPGHAILLDCRSRAAEWTPLPDVSIVVIHSMVRRELTGGGYRSRVRECAEACALLGVSSLRDVTDSPALPPRARHVVRENARVQAFAAACRGGDLAAMGQLMLESHTRLREDFEVSCPELDFLVEKSRQFPGVYGARLTGGGFGGCVVTLVERGAESAFEAYIQEEYAARWGITPDIFRVEAGGGAFVVEYPGPNDFSIKP